MIKKLKQVLQNEKIVAYGVPLFFVFINFFLKFKNIMGQSITDDESFSIYYAQYDIVSIIKYLIQGNNPPLFEIILHFWTKIFGIGVRSVRFLPFFFSSVAVFFIYRIGRDFFNINVAIIASLLFTFSNYQMYFAHETRIYAMFMLLSTVSMYFFIHELKEHRKIYVILIIVTNVLLVYSHFLSFFILFAQFLISFLQKEDRKKIILRNSKILMMVLIFYLPYIYVFIFRFYDSAKHGTWVSPVESLWELHYVLVLLVNGSTTNFLIFWFAIWLFVQNFIAKQFSNIYIQYTIAGISIFYMFYGISMFVGLPGFKIEYWKFSGETMNMSLYLIFVVFLFTLASFSNKINFSSKAILVWFFAPLLVMFLSSFKIPMFIERYWIFITPAFSLLLAIGASEIEKEVNLKLSFLLIVTLGMTFTTNPENNHHIWELMQKFKEIKTENTLIYIAPRQFAPNFAYYYDKNVFKITEKKGEGYDHGLIKKLNEKNIYPIYKSHEIELTKIEKAEKVIFIDDHSTFLYPNNNIIGNLEKNLGKYQKYEFKEGLVIYEFNKKK